MIETNLIQKGNHKKHNLIFLKIRDLRLKFI